MPRPSPRPLAQRAGAHPRLLAGAAVLLVVGLVVLMTAVLLGGERQEPAAAGPDTPASDAGPASAPPSVDTTEDATYARARTGHPDRLVVPALGVDAPIRAIHAPDRTLVPPADPQVLGWWVDGARPGAATGSALVVGHTVHSGGGALDDLETLRPGDEVGVRSRRRGDQASGRTATYVVQDVEVYRKGTLARRAAGLFSQEVDGRLVLLTCEEWDGERYLSNVVVTAVPVGGDLRG